MLDSSDHRRNWEWRIMPEFKKLFSQQNTLINELSNKNVELKIEIRELNKKFDKLLTLMIQKENDQQQARKAVVYKVR